MLSEVKENLSTVRKNFYLNLDNIVSHTPITNRTEKGGT